MASSDRYRWFDPLILDLVESIFHSLSYQMNAPLPALIALARSDASAPLEDRHKTQLQRAKHLDPLLMRDELERVMCELKCEAAPEAAAIGQALLAGSGNRDLAQSFTDWADAALDSTWAATCFPIQDRMRSGFVTRALHASQTHFDTELDARSTVASLATLMGVLRDPLDHGPGTSAKPLSLAWLPYEHHENGALVTSRYQLLHTAYTERAAALGAANPEKPRDQACVIAEELNQDIDTIVRARTRQCGPQWLEDANATMRPMSAKRLTEHLGLGEPAPIRHLWVGALALVDSVQRRLLAQGNTPVEIESAFASYPLQRVRHSFDHDPEWPHRLIRQIESVRINVRRVTGITRRSSPTSSP